MNYLQLVNRVRRECGASSGDLGTVQGSLIMEDRRFKDWVSDAWRDLQTSRADWNWMAKSFAFNTDPDKQSYGAEVANAADLAQWDRDSLRVYDAGTAHANESALLFVDRASFRDSYEIGSALQARGRPTVYTVDRANRLRFHPTPNAAYTIHGDYWRRASELVLDTDTPDIPEQFHMLIVWGACRAYGYFESAQEVIARAESKHRELLNRLLIDQLPVPGWAPPLA